MFRRWDELNNFRHNCEYHNIFNYFDAYELLGDDDECLLYEAIESSLLSWVKENTEHDVFYDGDLRFEFESKEERDQFDTECGDPVAFKLRWA